MHVREVPETLAQHGAATDLEAPQSALSKKS